MHHIWRFGPCEFDEGRLQLRVQGSPVDIEVKPLEVLRQLLRHAGEVVTKDELLETVWPGVIVVDGSLATAVSKLRKALGSDDLIVTLPRVGYRLAVPVTLQPLTAPPVSDLRLEAGAPVPQRPEWRLTRRLDPSASGEVWLANHPKTRETRVVKFADDEVRLKSLKREVTIARLLRESFPERQDFVRVLEWSFDARPYFLESEYAGQDLAEWAEHAGGVATVPMAVRLRIVADVARAVGAVHQVGVLHKDLKPRNILVEGPAQGPVRVRVADFGAAALMSPDRLDALGITKQGFTQTEDRAGSVTGTLMYIAPEVLAGQSPTEATDVYALGVLLYQMIAGDLRKPMAAGWEHDVADALLQQDIAGAAAGDPARRLSRAGELAHRLDRLQERHAEADQVAAARDREAATRARHERARRRQPWMALAALLLLAVAVVIWRTYRVVPEKAVQSIAVLPFQNVGSDRTIDFLQFAVPDEMATILGQVRHLSVRSFGQTRRFDPGADPLQAGRDLHVSRVVTGHYLKAGDTWQITIEAIDVAAGGVAWRDTIAVPAGSPVAMWTQLLAKTRGGLAPALGTSMVDAATAPRSDQAYLMFLESESVGLDPEPNRGAVATLERAVAIDPNYGPMWVQLARRYYVLARYDTNASDALERSAAAAERALVLDPNDLGAGASLTVVRLERGDSLKAYREAADLVRRRPDSADAHFTLSYVLRFAGLLDESAAECNTAFLIDPHTQTSGLRSCAVVFILNGDGRRARDFIQLDFGSDWANALTIHTLVREGHVADALKIAPPHIPQWNSYDMLLAQVNGRPSEAVAALAAAVKPSGDPETDYFSAAHLSYSGQTSAALEMLGRAIAGRYCSYPAMDTDPFFAPLRGSADFARLRALGAACQSDFMAHRAGN